MKTAGFFVNFNAWRDICANFTALPLSPNPVAIYLLFIFFESIYLYGPGHGEFY